MQTRVLTCIYQLQPHPEFFDHRIKMFDELKSEYDAFVAGKFLTNSRSGDTQADNL